MDHPAGEGFLKRTDLIIIFGTGLTLAAQVEDTGNNTEHHINNS